MNEGVKKLLKAAGYDSETIKAVSADELPEDFNLDDKIKSLEETNKERLFKLFENDEGETSLKARTIKENDGKWTGIINNDLKKLGVPLEDIKDLPVHEKIKHTAEFLKEKTKEEFKDKNKNASEEVKELQQKLIESENKIKEVEEAKDAAILEAEKNAESKIISFRQDNDLQSIFSSIPAEKLITKKHSTSVSKAVESIIKSQFDVVYDDDGRMDFVIKGKSEKPTGEIDGKKIILTPEDVYKNILKQEGFWVESNGGGNGSGDGETVTKTTTSSSMDEHINKFKAAVN